MHPWKRLSLGCGDAILLESSWRLLPVLQIVLSGPVVCGSTVGCKIIVFSPSPFSFSLSYFPPILPQCNLAPASWNGCLAMNCSQPVLFQDCQPAERRKGRQPGGAFQGHVKHHLYSWNGFRRPHSLVESAAQPPGVSNAFTALG